MRQGSIIKVVDHPLGGNEPEPEFTQDDSSDEEKPTIMPDV